MSTFVPTGAPSSPAQRSTGTAASSDSSGTALTNLHALEAEDIVVDILADGDSKRSNSKLPFFIAREKPHVVTERSFFVCPRDSNGRPTHKLVQDMKIVVSELQIPCIIHEQEGLLFTRTTSNRDQITCLTTWLIQNYTLVSLQRVSVHLVIDMDALQTPSNPDIKGALEQRAAIVVEATAQRASTEAAAEDKSKSPTLKRIVRNIAPTVKTTKAAPKRIRRNELAEEQRTIEETLANFNRKIALFEKEDPVSAEMLIPAKLDLQNKLRLVSVLTESCKDDDFGTTNTAANVSQLGTGRASKEALSQSECNLVVPRCAKLRVAQKTKTTAEWHYPSRDQNMISRFSVRCLGARVTSAVRPSAMKTRKLLEMMMCKNPRTSPSEHLTSST
jgi:hypothetical protein